MCVSVCAPKGRGQHFYAFPIKGELRGERGRRIGLDESHPRLEFLFLLLPPPSAAERKAGSGWCSWSDFRVRRGEE